jgi:hypothetical protein
MVVATAAATTFVVLRWLDAAHRMLGRFVLAGSLYANRGRAPKGLPIRAGSGYDGQFYYRLALDPFNLARTAFGIQLDTLSRVERMAYPFLAWVISQGHSADVPLALVAVNVFAAGMLGLAGGLLARSAGRHALWGLVFVGYWGYLWTLGRDLTELTTAALVIFGLAALLRNAPFWAGLAFLGAIVSKETAVLLVATLAAATAWARWSGRTSDVLPLNAPPVPGIEPPLLRRSDLAFIVPLVGFVAWQLVLLWATGRLPIYKSGGENLGPPFVGFVHGLTHYLAALPSIAAGLWFGELALLIVLAVVAARSLRHVPVELRILWTVAILLAVFTATGIWLGDVGFRSLDDVYLVSWVVLLLAPVRLTPVAVLCGAAWGAVAAELIHFI